MQKNPISTEADRCVKCGLCLPHCPTYALNRLEGDSPRGRIALIQAIQTGEIDYSEARTYLDHCLLCRACENVCPSGVRYGWLMDEIRAQQGQPFSDWFLSRLFTSRSTHPLLKLSRNPAIPKLMRHAGQQIQTLVAMLPEPMPPAPPPIKAHYPAIGKKRGEVALFTGCLGDWLDQLLLQSAITLLQHSGHAVNVPHQQVCCGAIDRHTGGGEHAGKLNTKNLEIFNALEIDAIVSCASGCGAQLIDTSIQGEGFRHPIQDISTFLLNHADRLKEAFLPTKKRVLLHTPCTLGNVMHSAQYPKQLLSLIPGLKITEILHTHCCGAAGTYMLKQKTMANQLRAPLLEIITDKQPDRVLTSNSGCAMHLRAGIRQTDIRIPVQHPVELLAEHLMPQKFPETG